MATATQTMSAEADHSATASTSPATSTERLAAGMLTHAHPHYSFAFTPFLQTNYHHGLPADRPICKAYTAGHCPLGSRCPERHVSSSSGTTGGGRDGGFNSLVCKHWLRGLCKKGEGCEFLHEYNLRKMPECNFFLRNGYCSNGDECLYLHIDPRSKLPPCPDYDNRGFCALGPTCPKKHVRRTLCPYYLAGFCPDGRTCKEGAHPHWSPVAVVVPLPPAEEAAEGTPTMGAFGDEEMGGMGGTPDGEYQPQQPHFENSEDDRDRPHGHHRGGFKGRGGGVGGGGRWRGRGGGHKFRGGRNF